MSKKAAKILLTLSTIIFIAGLIFYVAKKDVFSADFDLGQEQASKSIKVNFNGREKKFVIKSYLKNGTISFYIFETALFKVKQTKLYGFENNVDLCANEIIKLTNGDAFCLEGEVGAHSKNIQILKTDLTTVKLSGDENGKLNLVSDLPDFRFEDYNQDGTTDLTIDNRNYDKDPLTNIKRKYFIGRGEEFVFEKEEDYNNSSK